MDQAKFKEALEEIEILERSDQLTKNQLLALRYLKSTLYLRIGKFKDGKVVAEQLLDESKEVGAQEREFDALINISWAFQGLGEINAGIQIIRRGEKLVKILTMNQPLSKKKKALFFYQKGSILLTQSKMEESIKFLGKSLSLREEINDKAGIAQSLTRIGDYYVTTNERDQILECSQRCLAISEAIGDQQEEANSYRLMAEYYIRIGDLSLAYEYVQKSVAICEAIGDQYGLARSFRVIGNTYLSKGELDKANEIYQKSLTINETIGNQLGMASTLNNISIIYSYKGELDQTIEYQQKSLIIFERIERRLGTAIALNNLGCFYGEKSDFKTAIESFEKSLSIARELENVDMIAEILYSLIRLFVHILPPSTVTSYLDELKVIKRQQSGFAQTNQKCRLAEAIVLKSQGRLVDMGTAQSIFRQIVEEKIVWFELTVEATINLCELLLFELETTGNEAALNELKNLTNKLLKMAKDQNSYWLLAETYLIQSKLQLMELNLHEARDLLTQAHLITKEKNLGRLEKIISIEHDSLIKQLSTWEKIVEEQPTMSERIKLTQLEGLINRMIHKRLYQNEDEIIAYAENAHKLVKMWERNPKRISERT